LTLLFIAVVKVQKPEIKSPGPSYPFDISSSRVAANDVSLRKLDFPTEEEVSRIK